MPSIKNSDFVKSRHILNIVSESAKIAIRDYIDNLTIKTNDKVEKIAASFCKNLTTIDEYLQNLTTLYVAASGLITLKDIHKMIPNVENQSKSKKFLLFKINLIQNML
jgi:hypothetical protein